MDALLKAVTSGDVSGLLGAAGNVVTGLVAVVVAIVLGGSGLPALPAAPAA
ncbi:hypothetical protein GA0115240_11708 [Streptomyces sp. DvalAA-14]|uniref:hypothetical protein n=1 Tax=unclassified Streptomyces TaxID=2593676 RepID=UPI00081B7F22|nr:MULTISPECIES: hypothetical protein [unclassified Streptomyces]MYS20146.1 hypothetical protein [Streptomyces sp. SID4948]SCD61987.1 hypothetical protein GA0115240_11708 [Streptomyces sp. DvalAA-14]